MKQGEKVSIKRVSKGTSVPEGNVPPMSVNKAKERLLDT